MPGLALAGLAQRIGDTGDGVGDTCDGIGDTGEVTTQVGDTSDSVGDISDAVEEAMPVTFIIRFGKTSLMLEMNS